MAFSNNYTTVVESVDTWDNGARAAMFEIVDNFNPTEPAAHEIPPNLKPIRDYLNFIISRLVPESSNGPSKEQVFEYWRNFGFMCFEVAVMMGVFSKPRELHREEIINILIKKQRDYGHDNIARFGRVGIAIRLHDKVARLENLTTRNTSPQNESVVDNFIDLVGYAAIGVMWEKDWYMQEVTKAQ